MYEGRSVPDRVELICITCPFWPLPTIIHHCTHIRMASIVYIILTLSSSSLNIMFCKSLPWTKGVIIVMLVALSSTPRQELKFG